MDRPVPQNQVYPGASHASLRVFTKPLWDSTTWKDLFISEHTLQDRTHRAPPVLRPRPLRRLGRARPRGWRMNNTQGALGALFDAHTNSGEKMLIFPISQAEQTELQRVI